MTFPLIRPEDVRDMPEPLRCELADWLAEEMTAAADRDRELWDARIARALQPRRTAPPLGRPRLPDEFTEGDRAEAEAVLGPRRLLVLLGLKDGDGSRLDDLRVAYAAVHRGGSTNPYLLALAREYDRNRRIEERAALTAQAEQRRARWANERKAS